MYCAFCTIEKHCLSRRAVFRISRARGNGQRVTTVTLCATRTARRFSFPVKEREVIGYQRSFFTSRAACGLIGTLVNLQQSHTFFFCFHDSFG